MDDITLSGPVDIVVTDTSSLKDKSISFGVYLNTGNHESVAKTASISVALLTVLNSLTSETLNYQ